MGLCLGVFWISAGIDVMYYIAMIGTIVVAGHDQTARNLVLLLDILGFLALQFWLWAGITIAMVKIAKGQYVEFGEVFRGDAISSRYSVPLCSIWLAPLGLSLVFAIPVGLLMNVLTNNDQARVLIFVVLEVVMILGPIALMLRLGQSFYLIVDRDAGALQFLRFSYDITCAATE